MARDYRAAGLASGAARRDRVAARDLEMALARIDWPGDNTFSKLGEKYGIDRMTAYRAVKRVQSHPAIAEAKAKKEAEIEAEIQAFVESFRAIRTGGALCAKCGAELDNLRGETVCSL